jgi:hypothetical protein
MKTMLERWEDNITERRTIEEFWDWLPEYCHKHNLTKDHVFISDVLNEYHNIDIKQLEKERRELLIQQKEVKQ